MSPYQKRKSGSSQMSAEGRVHWTLAVALQYLRGRNQPEIQASCSGGAGVHSSPARSSHRQPSGSFPKLPNLTNIQKNSFESWTKVGEVFPNVGLIWSLSKLILSQVMILCYQPLSSLFIHHVLLPCLGFCHFLPKVYF